MAVASAASAFTNVGLSIALAGPLGLTGVALGTLIPTSIEALCFLFPYTMRVLELPPRETVRSILWPALAPAVPMILVLHALRPLASAPSLAGLAGLAALGCLVYLAAYVSLGASAAERRTYRRLVGAALRLAEIRRQR